MAANKVPAPEAATADEDHLTALPLDVLECILILLDKRDLTAAALTCKTLHSFITSDSFVLRMLRHHMHSSSTVALTLLHLTRKWPWCQRASLCYLNPFGKNLLKGGSAQQLQGHADKPYGSGGSEKLKTIPHWRILSNEGDGWQVERPPIGADPVPEHLSAEGGGCYVTSYLSCTKQQVVRFREQLSGCPKFMDHVQPLISVSVWVAGRHDCDSCYRISVDLLSRKGRVLHTWQRYVDLGPSFTGTQWVQVTHEVGGYGRGAAALRFRHSGRDRRMWAGWYGPKITGARVVLGLDPSRGQRPVLTTGLEGISAGLESSPGQSPGLDQSADQNLGLDHSPDDEESDADSSEHDSSYEGDDDYEENYGDDDYGDEEEGDEGPNPRHAPAAGNGFFGNVRNFFKF